MNDNAWERLYQNSLQLKKPARVENLLSKEDIDEVRYLILEIIKGFLEKGEVHIGLKTYVNKELVNNIANQMLSQPPEEDDSLEGWLSKIFGEEKFGIVFNFLEKYSNEFAEKAATIVAPLLNLAGMPLEGLSFLLFMGNYGFTPFGIHKESVGEEGILFHIGPGNKQFYTWDDPKLNAIKHNTQVFHNVDELLPDAQLHELKLGDAMFIPHQVYHIANTDEFSISLVMDYINPPTERFEKQLFQLATEEILENRETYMQPLKMNSSQEEWKNLLNTESIQKNLELTFQRRITALKSNGGIARSSNSIKNFNFPNGSFAVKNSSTFPIYLEELPANRVLIFARGHRILKDSHPALSKLIRLLNDGNAVTFEKIQEMLIPHWELSDIFAFVSELLQKEALKVDGN